MLLFFFSRVRFQLGANTTQRANNGHLWNDFYCYNKHLDTQRDSIARCSARYSAPRCSSEKELERINIVTLERPQLPAGPRPDQGEQKARNLPSFDKIQSVTRTSARGVRRMDNRKNMELYFDGLLFSSLALVFFCWLDLPKSNERAGKNVLIFITPLGMAWSELA